MVHGDNWLNPMRYQFVDDVVVEGDGLLVDAITHHACRYHAWPSHGEAVALHPHGCHHGNVLLVLVVEVVRDVTRRTFDAHHRRHGTRGLLANGTRHADSVSTREGIPNGRPAPVFVVCPLDLVRRGPETPLEALREVHPLPVCVRSRIAPLERHREIIFCRALNEARAAGRPTRGPGATLARGLRCRIVTAGELEKLSLLHFRARVANTISNARAD
mmetsp:Transcript_54418/g.137432  ORF Transcript_54418/g.137432 Transcript_54418/m.137432 type:complete len:217 (+) Transcript_54418:1542-2192(+)